MKYNLNIGLILLSVANVHGNKGNVKLRGAFPLHDGRLLGANQCSLGEDIVKCEAADRGCNDFDIEHCAVFCHDACQGTKMNASTVECARKYACKEAVFRNSTVNCRAEHDLNCHSAEFFASAVTCGHTSDGYAYGSCYNAVFDHCSCCEKKGGGCWDGRQCYDKNGKAKDFCAKTFLGRTCKDWGNPVCKSISIPRPRPIHRASKCSLGEEIVECEGARRGCAAADIKQCAVLCHDACQKTNIEESTVECVHKYACKETIFRKSTVNCRAEHDLNCHSAEFFASAVTCGHTSDGYAYGSCYNAVFDPCSCCDGPGCPGNAPKCYDPMTKSVDKFCDTKVLGKTCKAWGNPICNPPQNDIVNVNRDDDTEGTTPIDSEGVAFEGYGTEMIYVIFDGDNGKWKPWVRVTDDPDLNGFFGCGARLKYEKPLGFAGDDTGVNGLDIMFCDYQDNWNDKEDMIVYSGDFGKWGDWRMCPEGSYIAGARVRYNDIGGNAVDDTALVGLRILCRDPNDSSAEEWKTVDTGDLKDFGEFKNPISAPKGMFLTGARVKYEDHDESFMFDDTAMNGIEMSFAAVA